MSSSSTSSSSSETGGGQVSEEMLRRFYVYPKDQDQEDDIDIDDMGSNRGGGRRGGGGMGAAEFYSNIFEDVQPVPQADAPNSVVNINYSPLYRGYMDLFRAVLLQGEYSLRVLRLTKDLLEINPSNYTVWQYRRDCMRNISGMVYKLEFDFMNEFADSNPKNYQIWHHRRAVVEDSGFHQKELEFTARVLSVDEKNYHAWSHRQWAILTYDLFDGELAFVDTLLEKDLLNNSAWNQRWFAVHKGTQVAAGALDEGSLRREIEYTFERVDRSPNNESAWSYLRGLYTRHGSALDGLAGSLILANAAGYIQVDIDGDDIGEDGGEGGEADGNNNSSSGSGSGDSDEHEGAVHAAALCALISENSDDPAYSQQLYASLVRLDPIRSKYWSRKEREMGVRL